MHFGRFQRKKSSAANAAAAAAWVARRDRGLSAQEQDEYLQWLRDDDQRVVAIAQAEMVLGRMLRLSDWRREHSVEPNPDLLAPRGGRPGWVMPTLAAAAAFALLLGWWSRPSRTPPSPRATVTTESYLHVNERIMLPDGSSAELKDGSVVDVRYTAGERRVRLTGGEAQFSVMKDASRPFVVEANGVAVRAVGTVFEVELSGGGVAVLVTEGKVQVGRAARQAGFVFLEEASLGAPALVLAGEQAVMPLGAAVPVISQLSPDDLRAALAWQAPRFRFDETPLAEAIAAFNRRNRHQLVLGDASLGTLPVGGSFRPENVDGFVRLLSVTFGMRAQDRTPDVTVLWRGN